MLDQISTYLSIGFLAITLYSLYMLYAFLRKADIPNGKAGMIVLAATAFGGIMSALAYNGFFATGLDQLPPRFLLVVLPAFILIFICFNSKKSLETIYKIPLLDLSYFHWIRIPVEIILYGLALDKAIPEVMSFAGRNFDILAGIIGPLVAYFGIYKVAHSEDLKRKALIAWNILGLILLINIIITAILSVQTPFQQFGLDQPNQAILYFPFILLPAIVVPIVLFAHFAALKKLFNGRLE